MRNYAGKKAFAFVENRGIAKTDCGSINNLEQSFKNRRSGKKIDYMSDSKGKGGNDYSRFQAVFCHSAEKHSPENNFLKKTHKTHCNNRKQGGKRSDFEGKSEPEIYRRNQDKVEIEQKIFCRFFRSAKSEILKKPVSLCKNRENQRKNRAEDYGEKFWNTEGFGKRISGAESDHIDYNP